MIITVTILIPYSAYFLNQKDFAVYHLMTSKQVSHVGQVAFRLNALFVNEFTN